MLRDKQTAHEMAYSDALTHLAIGEDRDDARGYLVDEFTELTPDEIGDALADAYADGMASGINPDDVGRGW